MIRKNYEVYTIAAFRFYAKCGRPDSAKLSLMREDPRITSAEADDLDAVFRVVDRLAHESDGAAALLCLERVYFTRPSHMPTRGETTERVRSVAIELNTSESFVYRLLHRIKWLFAIERGLRTEGEA